MGMTRMLPAGFALLLGFVLPLRAAESAHTATGKHSAWKVQGKNCSVHLLGSVHILKEENYPLPDVFERAFSNASIVVFETDIGKMMEAGTQMKLISRASLPKGQTLKDVLSEETYADLQRYLKDSETPSFMVDTMKPSMAAMTLVMMECLKAGYSQENGMDVYFYGQSRKARKTVRGLEDLDFQLSLICDLSKAEGEALIESTLKDLSQAEDQFASLLKAWQTGDEASLEKLLNEAEREYPVVMKKFLTDRNKQWVPQIEALASGTNNAVVIVGAAHLVGKDGVVDLLRKKGVKVFQE